MSALNLNKVIFCGRLTADVELKATPSGQSVVTFTLAINRPRSKDGAEQKADFLSCVAWEKKAEFISRYFKKGDSIYLEGEARTRNYKDKEGRTVYVTEFLVNEARFVDSKSTAADPSIPPAIDTITPSGDEDLPF